MKKITHSYSTQVGITLIIWITGDINLYIAEVVQEEPEIILKVEETGPYAHLKPGDYIIKEYYSSQWHGGQEKANKLLSEAIERGRPVLSGLNSLGVKDGKLHEIGPYYE